MVVADLREKRDQHPANSRERISQLRLGLLPLR